MQPNYGLPVGVLSPNGAINSTDSSLWNVLGQVGGTQAQAANSGGGGVLGDSTVNTGPTAAQQQAATDAQTKSQNALYLQDQAGQLRDLLTRNDTSYSHGLAGNQDAYDTGAGTVNQQHDAQVTSQNKGKQSAYDTINSNANNGYRSLAQIIGRASGTGSSAFQQLLPDVIGRDTSSKRQGATDTFGQNLSNIDASTTTSLADLLKQKKAADEATSTGYQNNRQSFNGQLSQNAGQLAQNNGGDFNAVKAAQQPFADAINNSRNAVEGFFNQYRTPFTPQAVDPNLAQYQTDRSAVNAQSQPGADGSNPYSQLLRKKLQGIA